MKLLPFTIIMATCERPQVLQATLNSVLSQSALPAEIVIIDASKTNHTFDAVHSHGLNTKTTINYRHTDDKGAATQRNLGLQLANPGFEVIGFMDDDIILQSDCLLNLWAALSTLSEAGGVNAMITNQKYHEPHLVTRLFYRLIDTVPDNYGGKLIGPLVNILPSDDDSLGNHVEVEWLNTTCTIYKKAYLPNPVFDEHFKGYSLMEDLALSLRVKKIGKLYNIRNARIFHDTQPGDQKNDIGIMSEMELVNRYYIMKHIAEMNTSGDHFKLLLQQLFFAIVTKNIFRISFLKGKINALKKLKKI